MIGQRRGQLLAAILCLAAVTLPRPGSLVQGADAATTNAGKGKPIYKKLCASCHGPHGKGDGYKILGPDPADLTSPLTQKKTDRELLTTIHKGKPNRNMPAWDRRLSEQEARDVLAYVRSLSRRQ
jgi:mono/diheme cytochrome c family protein